MSNSPNIVITGAQPTAQPEMPEMKIDYPQPTAEEIKGGAICTPIHPTAGSYPDCYPGSKLSTES